MASVKQPNATTSTHTRVNLGIVGLGRMGQKHALNLIQLVPRANLICACSPAQADLDWAAGNLAGGPYGIKTYPTVEEMYEKHPDLEAVIIASATHLHLTHTTAALDRGLHVLCEKPIATSIPDLESLVRRLEKDEAEKREKKERGPKLMVGFTRRFDDSYMDVHDKIRAGAIGRPTVIRSQGCEIMPQGSPWSDAYLRASGGIFLDTVIHDIDLALHLLGDNPIPKSVSAHGVVAAFHDALDKANDADNAVGVCEFWGGQIAFFYNSRTASHGYDNQTEIFGSGGKLSVNLVPRRNRVELCDGDGLVKVEPTPGWYDRYEGAFATELRVWIDAVLDEEKEMPVTAAVALKSLVIARALQDSLEIGARVNFTRSGVRLDAADAGNGSGGGGAISRL